MSLSDIFLATLSAKPDHLTGQGQAHLHGEHARTTAAASRGAGSRDDAAYAQDQASSGGMSGAAWAAHDRGRA